MSQVSLDFDVSAAARILARDMARVARGQEVLIYADSESDSCVVNETAKAIHNEGAKVADRKSVV